MLALRWRFEDCGCVRRTVLFVPFLRAGRALGGESAGLGFGCGFGFLRLGAGAGAGAAELPPPPFDFMLRILIFRRETPLTMSSSISSKSSDAISFFAPSFFGARGFRLLTGFGLVSSAPSSSASASSA